jgi:transposase
VIRQRIFWVRERTKVRSRIHKIISRQHNLNMPKVTDLFGKKGRAALNKAVLPDPDAMLLKQNLELLDTLGALIKEDEQRIGADGVADPKVQILQSIPGIGLVIGSVIATEIDTINRFGSAAKLASYCGLVPSTHSSGGKTYHGRMINQCNKWLKWAFIEAAWVSVGCSPYFGALYREQRERGKKANTAITITARRMSQVVYRLLKEERMYEERMYSGRSGNGLTASAA